MAVPLHSSLTFSALSFRQAFVVARSICNSLASFDFYARLSDALQLLQWTIQTPTILPPRQLHKSCSLAGTGESFFFIG